MNTIDIIKKKKKNKKLTYNELSYFFNGYLNATLFLTGQSFHL